jgi:hypothetical protein
MIPTEVVNLSVIMREDEPPVSGDIIVPEQIQQGMPFLPKSKKGPGLTAAEQRLMSSHEAEAARFAQTQGEKVGYKAGVQASIPVLEKIRKDFAAKKRAIVAELQAAAREKLTTQKQAQKEGSKNIADIKQRLTDYAKANLTLHDRGKLIATVKNVKNEKGLAKAIDTADRLSEQHNQRVLRAKFNKLLKRTKPTGKKTKKGKFVSDTEDQLKEIRRDMDKDRETVRKDVIANIDILTTPPPDMTAEQLEAIAHENEMMSMQGIKGMTAAELEIAVQSLTDILNEGKTLRQVKDTMEKERIGAIRRAIFNVLTDGRGLQPGAESLPQSQLTKEKTIIEHLFNWGSLWNTLMDKLSKFDKQSLPGESIISQLGNTAHYAAVEEALGVETWMNEIKRGIARIFGVSSDSEINSVINGLQQKVKLGPFLNADGVEVELVGGKKDPLTRDALIKKWMEMQDPTLRATFEGKVDEKTGNISGMRWTDEIMQAVEAELTTEEQAYGRWMLDFYRKYYKGVNEVYRRHYNIDLPFNEFYSPIGRELDVDTPENLLLIREAANFQSTKNGSLISRQGSIKKLKYSGATRVMVNHVMKMEHFKHWTQAISDLRRVFRNTNIRNAILQYHGKDILDKVDQTIEKLARGGVLPGRYDRLVDGIRRRFTKSILGIKPHIALKQIPSLLAYTTKMSYGDFAHGVMDFWKHPIENFRTMRDMSPELRKRWGKGFERDIKDAMKTNWAKNITRGGQWSDHFFDLIRAGDKFATMQGTWAAYQAGIKAGLSETEAMRKAERITNETQPSGDINTIAFGMSEGSFYKLFTMFMTQPNKYFNVIANNARNLRYGRGSKAKAISNILVTWLVLPMLFQFLADGLRWKKERQIQAMALGPLNNILVWGQLIKSAIGWAMGDTFDYQASPALTTPGKAQRGISKLTKEEPDTEDIIEGLEYLAEAVMQTTGVPTYLVQAEKAVRKGQTKNLLFSEFVTKEEEPEGPKRATPKRRKVK